MFVPKHCSEVAVINAGKRFLPEKTLEELSGNCIFYLTKYVILRERDGRLKSGERASIIRVKAKGENLLKTIVGGELLVSPDKCVTLVDPTLDEFVLNQLVLEAASMILKKGVEAVILSGRNENITFVYLGEQELMLPLKILLVDVTPPRPSRLETLTGEARVAGLISEHINIESLNVDAYEIVKDGLEGGRRVFSPCPTGEFITLNSSILGFKDIVKKKENKKTLSIDLVGCSLSQAVLNELRKIKGLDIKESLKDICPLHLARENASRANVKGIIVRCCKIINNPQVIHVNSKPLIVLSWTPTLGELVKAVDDIVRLITGLRVE